MTALSTGSEPVQGEQQPQSHISNPALTKALKAMEKGETAEKREALYEALMTSMLILPAPEGLADDEPLTPITEEDDLHLVTFETDEGESVLIAFTDEEAALAWEPEGMPYLGLRGLDALLIAAQNEISELIINPASPTSFRLHRADIQALAMGEAPVQPADRISRAEPGMMVLISEPAEMPPQSWQETLRGVLEHYPSIENAYFFQLHLPPEGERHVIGLVLYEGMSATAQERMLKTMLAEFETMVPKDQSLDFVVLEEEDFLRTVQDTVSPIYTSSL
jgi:hypothetical protein